MLDFVKIAVKENKKTVEVFPKFLIKRSSDLMIRGGDFYAVWDNDRKIWSTEEDDVIRLVDCELKKYVEEHSNIFEGQICVKYMWDADSGSIDKWHKYCQKQMRDQYHTLDEKLIFANDEVKKTDYSSKRLSYPLEDGDMSAYDKLISTLYSPEERRKIEWAIGSIITGDSKTIQKFMVLYGSAGTGKSTILNIIQKLFEGYYSVFDAKALGSSSNSFALEAFKCNPLVAIQHDGDLSRIEDNTRLNSLVSHEFMTINEKFKSTYANRFKCFLFMGTNKPVKITDGKSGLIRRLIDVHPSGKKLSMIEYKKLVSQIDFELGAIASHCRKVYLENPGYYDNYIPTAMLSASNDFYNFILDSFHVFRRDDGTTLKAAWERYKTYCDEAKVPYPFSQRNFKEELKNYFWNFDDRFNLEDGSRVRSYYSKFKMDIFDIEDKETEEDKNKLPSFLIFKEGIKSIFDEERSDCYAQYANEDGTPFRKWEKVKTKLSNLDTSKLHYVKIPNDHIVVDFDLKDDGGNKSLEKNIEAASKWPPTYAEISKSGCGIHLHYVYTGGDVSKLSRIYSDNIEIKVFTGNSSLRRKLTKCNEVNISTINSGLPIKEENRVVNFDRIQSERSLRSMIERNMNKEFHGATKPSIDFIYKILEDAYNSGMKYDVTDMRNSVLAFGASSTNQSEYCIRLVNNMHFKSEFPSDKETDDDDEAIIFYDIEIFPNLFIVCWKTTGEDSPIVRMINPSSKDIEDLIKFRLIGFNNRRYDNHILYAAIMGYSVEELYRLSQSIINAPKGEQNKYLFKEAYNLSYTDVYDFSAKKQSLKKWEIELGIHHQELGLPWDKPVPKEKWLQVAEYCDNDVIATEKVFNHLKGDFTARQILADMAGMSVNDTTNTLTTRIIFGKERKPQLVYTDLSTGERTDGSRDTVFFPEYSYENGKNMYRGVDMGYGGYVYAEPGMYGNVALLDVQSMHPNSAINLNAFGEYTGHFKDILDTRISIKKGDYESARKLFNGKLTKYLEDESTAKDLAQALKIAINSVYGLTSANFENPFRDIRNKNNIVALRGALFMKTLQDEVQNKGYKVVHIKTDSIKIADADETIIDFCMEFGKKYGYIFEHEATYERMCLVNNAVYIAKYENGDWTATGKQFAVPYVFKTLFSKEPITMDDMRETFSVKSALYLDMNEGLPDVYGYEKELEKLESKYKKGQLSDTTFEPESSRLSEEISKGHDYVFIGKVGEFCPVKNGKGGGLLCREQDGKYYAASGTTGYRWLEYELISKEQYDEYIDRSYYDNLVSDAVETISKYGDFEWFVSDDPYLPDYEVLSRNINDENLPF